MIRIRFPVVEIEDLQPGYGAHFIRLILPKWNIVLLLAGHRAGHATGTFIHIDDHAVAKSV
jgi:hypothetical protein